MFLTSSATSDYKSSMSMMYSTLLVKSFSYIRVLKLWPLDSALNGFIRDAKTIVNAAAKSICDDYN